MSESGTSVRSRPTVRRIYIPTRESSFAGLLMLSVGFIAGLGLGGALVGTIAVPLTAVLPQFFGIALVLVFLGFPVAAFLLLVQKLQIGWILRPSARRSQRLARISTAGPSAARLCHRLVEQVLRLRLLPMWRTLGAYKLLPPGMVLFVDPPRNGTAVLPPPIMVPFEPLRVGVDDPELAQLFFSQALPEHAARPPDSVSSRVQRWINYVTALAFWVVLAGLVTRFVYQLLKGTARFSTQSPATWFVAIVVLRVVNALVADSREQWFVLPGALVHWAKPLLRRGSVVTVARLSESAFAFDWKNSVVCVNVAGKARGFRYAVDGFKAILAALLSPARCPTDAELAAWFGPDARIVSGATRAHTHGLTQRTSPSHPVESTADE